MSTRRLSFVWALVALLLHLAVNAGGGYGWFRDELYYRACSEHLAAGYVDHPPLSIFVLAGARAIFGESLFAARLVPALAAAATVYLTGRLAARMGAGSAGQALACLAQLCSPIALAFGGYYSMNAFDLLLWTADAYLFASLLERERPRTWIALGLVTGLALLNKISALWLLLGIFVGFVSSPQRATLRTRWPWIAVAIASACFLPYVVWNAQHDFAQVEFVRNATAGKYAGLSAWSFLAGQIPIHQPLSAPLWIAGLFFLLFAQRARACRPLVWIWITSCAVLALNGQSKSEYLAAAQPILFAAGGAAVGTLRWRWVRPAYGVLLAATTALLLPLVLPILPVESYIRYAARLHVAPSTSEHKELGALPQFFADMFGWQEKAATVARVYHSLPAAEQRACAIFASNYGECAALDAFGPALGLPASIGNHNNYWIWGPRGATGEVLIVLGRSLGERASLFESVEVAAQVAHDPYCMPYEDGLSVFVCRGLKRPLAELWPGLKHYD